MRSKGRKRGRSDGRALRTLAISITHYDRLNELRRSRPKIPFIKELMEDLIDEEAARVAARVAQRKHMFHQSPTDATAKAV